MKYSPKTHPRANAAARANSFTLLELLVSMAVLSLLMVLVFSMVDNINRTWAQTRANVDQFREARVAFENFTRKLGQATLNTYWDYDYGGGRHTPATVVDLPSGYQRMSELHFVCGPSATILNDPRKPTHCAFFQAPVGYSVDPENQKLRSLLNSWGYFVARDSDQDDRPEFIQSPARVRYRLMEFRPPTEYNRIYFADLKNQGSGSGTTTNLWFRDEIDRDINGLRFTRPIAENIIALIISPKESIHNTVSSTLAPKYIYDSRNHQTGLSSLNPEISKHVLPPIVDVTMVAIAEESALQLEQTGGEQMPELVPGSLFQDFTRYEEDLQSLEDLLQARNVNYKVFSESVVIRSSRFSQKL